MKNILDYKKEYKDLYLPKTEPVLIKIPEINYVTVTGKGNPNDINGEYKNAIEILYGIQYTIKMNKKGTYIPDGYFDYVVPPLEGFWWSDNETEMKNKSKYNWISVIRLPEYVTKDVFIWACTEASRKKKVDTSKAHLERAGLRFNEDTANPDSKGGLIAIYLTDEIVGFAIHPVQKN